MNTVIFSLVVLLALSSTALGIVCLPEFCDGAKCLELTTENCAGKIVPNGGFCGCCDACKSIRKVGESCVWNIRGIPIPFVCDDNLVCGAVSGKCEVAVV